MAYRSIAQRRYQRRTAAQWQSSQYRMAQAGIAALWLLGSAGALAVLLGSIAGGAWLAVQFGVGG